MRFILALLLMITPAFAVVPDPILPNPIITPGDIDPGVTMEKLCLSGYTGSVRNVSQSTKRHVFDLYQLQQSGDYEVDHLISLELGGSNSIRNLWPESYLTKPFNARVKDKLENRLHREICDGIITIEEAQDAIAHDWIGTYCALYDDMKKECGERNE